MSTKFPSTLPRSRGCSTPPASEAVVAITVEASFAQDQALRLTYRLDDGHLCTVDLLPTGPVPRPGQPILLFITSTNEPVRCSTLPWSEK